MNLSKSLLAVALPAMMFTACSDDPETIVVSEGEVIENVGDGGSVKGFYLLNEGNMGANKCTLDYFDYATKTYYRNIYAERNPNVVLELGDTGNDMAVNGDRLYIVVNGSHKVEVLDAATAVRVGQVDINSPRYLAFDGDNVYVSSFVGGDGDCGSVVRFDAKTLKVTGKCSVGLQPEEMVITGGKLYVANSGQLSPEYDNTISVVDLSTFTKTASIDAAINLHHLRLDEYGNMWATSRGNYGDIASSLVYLQPDNGSFKKIEEYAVGCTNLALSNSTMYYYTVTYDANWNATNSFLSNGFNAGGLDNKSTSFITDGTASEIVSPYCVAVQPSDGTIFITDAKNYVSSGELRCYSPAGKLQWTATTGDIPGHIAFVNK